MALRFLTEPEPARGQAVSVAPGIRRIVAANPGPMTYHGTNTYLVEEDDGVTVIDPGPDDPNHLAALLAAAGGRIARIVFTHRHGDHVGAVMGLKAATGAPVMGKAHRDSRHPEPDAVVAEGDRIGRLAVVHTPGHASDHLCFARNDGILFSGDHVMSWNSSIVSPPDGDMAAFFASLERLLSRDDKLFLPGHGPPLSDPRRLVRSLLGHRRMREAAILRAIGERPLTTAEIVERLYGNVETVLKPAAERNVAAHLEKLQTERRAAAEGESGRWSAV
jgi:glyoxylase-like metal-dependent hydrolase (beta-lactamase superfamily II)